MKKFIFRLLMYAGLAYLTYAVIDSNLHWVEQFFIILLIASFALAIREINHAPEINDKVPLTREEQRLDAELSKGTTQGRKSKFEPLNAFSRN